MPGDDLSRTACCDVTGTAPDHQSLNLDLTGTATDDPGVASVRVALRNSDTGQYVQSNGSLAARSPRVTPRWPRRTRPAPTFDPAGQPAAPGNYGVTAWAWDTAGQQDPSTTGATATLPRVPR